MSSEIPEIIKNEEKSLPKKENTTEVNEKIINKTFNSILNHFTDFLTRHSVYEAIPENEKVLVFNSDLCLKEMIKAFINEDIYCALIYDSTKQLFIGTITISDVLLLFNYITEKSKTYEINDISLFIKELFSEKKTLKKDEEESKKRNETKSIDILKHLDKINFKDYNKHILKKKSSYKNLISVSLDSSLLEVVKLIHKEGIHRIVVEETKKKNIENKKSKETKEKSETEETSSPEKKNKERASIKTSKKFKSEIFKKDEEIPKIDEEKKVKKKKLVKKKKADDTDNNIDNKDNKENPDLESIESTQKNSARKLRLKKKTVTISEKNIAEENNNIEEKIEKNEKDNKENSNTKPKSSRIKKSLTKIETVPEIKEEEDKKNNVDKKSNSDKKKTKKKANIEDEEEEPSEIQNYTGFITYETVFDFFIFNYYSKEMKEFNMTLNDLIIMEHHSFVEIYDIFSKKSDKAYLSFEQKMNSKNDILPIFNDEKTELFGFLFLRDYLYFISNCENNQNLTNEQFLVNMYEEIVDEKPYGKQRLVLLEMCEQVKQLKIKEMFEKVDISPEKKIVIIDINEGNKLYIISLKSIFDSLVHHLHTNSKAKK